MSEGRRTESDHITVRPEGRPALLSEEALIRIPTSDIVPMPDQPRQWFDPVEIVNLAESIKLHGQRTPVQVIQLSEGKYQLKSGERRLRACKKIEEETGSVFLMRAIVEPSHGIEEDFEDAVVENLNREDMLPLEKAASLHRLRTRNQRTLLELSHMSGKSMTYVQNYLLLHQLPEVVKALMAPERPKDDRLAVTTAIEIARIKDPELQFEIADHVLNARLTLRDTVHLIESKAHAHGLAVRDLHSRKRERKPSDDRAVLEGFMARTASFLIRSGETLDFKGMYNSHPNGNEILAADLERLDILKKRIDEFKQKIKASQKI